MTTVTLERTVEQLDGSEPDVEIEIGVSGVHRAPVISRAPEDCDPGDEPDVEILSVRHLHDADSGSQAWRKGDEIPLDQIHMPSLGDWERDAIDSLCSQSERDWE